MRRWVLVGLLASLVAVSTVALGQQREFYYTAPIANNDTTGTTWLGSGHRAQNYGTDGSGDWFWGHWTIEFWDSDTDSANYVTFYDLYENPDGTTAIRDSLVREFKAGADYCDIAWADSCHIWLYCSSTDSGQVTAHGTRATTQYGE